MIAGLNTDPQHFADDLGAHARNLKAAGFTMVRFPLVWGDDQGALAVRFCGALWDAGLDPLPVLVRESTSRGIAREINIRWWGNILPGVTHWQIGNEADHHSPSSWTLTEAEFSTLLRHAREALPHAYLIAGGMVSGQPDYLDGVDLSPVDAIAVHPYGQRPNGWPDKSWGFGWAAELLSRYTRFLKPIWVTEYGGPLADFGGDSAKRGRYYGAMTETCASFGPNIGAAFPFKYEDAGVPGFGIEGTPALAAASAAIATLTNSPLANLPQLSTPELSKPGGPMKLEEVAAKHGGLYSPAVTLSTSKGKPTARIAWVNRPEHAFILEINGEADGPYRPLA